jgi:hypothetical protein
MADTPSIDLVIKTGSVDGSTDKYYITFEVVNALGVEDTLFVVTRADKSVSVYTYSRVASISDLQQLEPSSITAKDSYRVNEVRIETTSLARIKDYKSNVPVVLKSLLDSVAKELRELVSTTETVPLQGSYDG